VRVTGIGANDGTVEPVGVAGYAHFLALAQRAQWDEREVELTLGGWDDERRQLLANLCLAETAVTEELDPIIALAPPEARPCLELQRGDEERHARFFARYAAHVDTPEPDDAWRERFEVELPRVAREGSLGEAVGLYHLVLEAAMLRPALQRLQDVAGVDRVLRDERWHIGLGVRVLTDLGVPQREILATLR
jgi:ribonucleoside-diphosphate reductase beta chain